MIEVRRGPRAIAIAVPAFSIPSTGLPAHVGVLLGLSTCAYALSLAAVSRLQSQSEADLAAQRAPALATIDRLNREYTRLESQLALARSAYQASADAYAATGSGFQAIEARLGDLAALVAEINGTSASMPASVSLPTISRSVSGAAAPAVHATTGASGG